MSDNTSSLFKSSCRVYELCYALYATRQNAVESSILLQGPTSSRFVLRPQAPECTKPDSLSRIKLGVCAMDKKVGRTNALQFIMLSCWGNGCSS